MRTPRCTAISDRATHQARAARPRRLRRLATAVVALAALLSPLSPSSAAPHLDLASAVRTTAHHAGIRVPSTFFGMHDSSTQAYGRVRFGALRLWDAGVAWNDLETSPGVYDWSRLDSLVSAAQAHGTKVMLVLAMTPSFYAAQPSLPPRDLGAYRAFVRAVMTRYRDFQGQRGIVEYQVWNEGNVPTFWTGSPRQLAQLTRIVHQVRAAVDPGATVVAPSFAVRLEGQRRWVSAYESQRVGGRPVWRDYDVNALSLYPMATYGSRTGGPEDAVGLLGGIRHRLAAAGVPRRMPLWATEINYGLPSGAPPGHLAAAPISAQRQAANVIRTYLLAAASGIGRVYWYRYDWGLLPPSMGGGTLGNTLLSDPSDHTVVTAAGQALQTVESWMRGRLVATGKGGPCARSARGTYTCVVRYAHGVRRIYWNPRHRVRIPVDTAATHAQDSLGRPLDVTRGGTAEVGYRPVMIESRG